MVEWREDLLGGGFEAIDIDLDTDDEGPLVATLVRSVAPKRALIDRLFRPARMLEAVDVLYVHGWSDYFFQTHLANFWNARGANFYALDLRKYGRSLRPGQTPGNIDTLDTYDEEIGEALSIIRHEGRGGGRRRDPHPETERPLILFGHSTGGLILSLWAARHPGVASALVLNSPWLEFQLTSVGRQLLQPLVDLSVKLNARDVTGFDAGNYSRAQREVWQDEYAQGVNLEWRPEKSNPIPAGWFRAILRGHALVADGLELTLPICVMLSSRSHVSLRWNEQHLSSDTVLDVDEVAKAALHLGQTVTIERIEGALHDVFLSREDARADAYARLDRWLTGWSATRAR